MREDLTTDELLAIQINVDLVGAIEERHSGSTCSTELIDEHRQIRVVARELHDDRKSLARECRDDGDVVSLDLSWICEELRLEAHHVDLQGICPCITQTLCKFDPATRLGAVDTGDDRHSELSLRLAHDTYIVLDSFAPHIGGDIVVSLGVVILSDEVPCLHQDLLFKERLEDDSTHASLYQGARTIHVAGKPRAPKDKGALQCEPSKRSA